MLFESYLVKYLDFKKIHTNVAFLIFYKKKKKKKVTLFCNFDPAGFYNILVNYLTHIKN